MIKKILTITIIFLLFFIIFSGNIYAQYEGWGEPTPTITPTPASQEPIEELAVPQEEPTSTSTPEYGDTGTCSEFRQKIEISCCNLAANDGKAIQRVVDNQNGRQCAFIGNCQNDFTLQSMCVDTRDDIPDPTVPPRQPTATPWPQPQPTRGGGGQPAPTIDQGEEEPTETPPATSCPSEAPTIHWPKDVNITVPTGQNFVHVQLAWNVVEGAKGATGYNVRFNDGQTYTTGGQFTNCDPSDEGSSSLYCYNNWQSNQMTVNVAPGKQFTWWVESIAPGCSPVKSERVEFTSTQQGQPSPTNSINSTPIPTIGGGTQPTIPTGNISPTVRPTPTVTPRISGQQPTITPGGSAACSTAVRLESVTQEGTKLKIRFSTPASREGSTNIHELFPDGGVNNDDCSFPQETPGGSGIYERLCNTTASFSPTTQYRWQHTWKNGECATTTTFSIAGSSGLSCKEDLVTTQVTQEGSNIRVKITGSEGTTWTREVYTTGLVTGACTGRSGIEGEVCPITRQTGLYEWTHYWKPCVGSVCTATECVKKIPFQIQQGGGVTLLPTPTGITRSGSPTPSINPTFGASPTITPLPTVTPRPTVTPTPCATRVPTPTRVPGASGLQAIYPVGTTPPPCQ